MEHVDAITERENTSFLLKTMVLLCILCVFITLYAEYRRMSKFEKLMQNFTPPDGRARLTSSSPCMREAHNDTNGHMPTPCIGAMTPPQSYDN